MAKRGRAAASYATAPWCMLDSALADELAEVTTWAYGELRADSARSCVSVALHLAPHVRAAREAGGVPTATVPVSDLAGECGLSPATTSRALGRLVGAGFLMVAEEGRGRAKGYSFRCHASKAGTEAKKGPAQGATGKPRRRGHPWQPVAQTPERMRELGYPVDGVRPTRTLTVE